MIKAVASPATKQEGEEEMRFPFSELYVFSADKESRPVGCVAGELDGVKHRVWPHNGAGW